MRARAALFKSWSSAENTMMLAVSQGQAIQMSLIAEAKQAVMEAERQSQILIQASAAAAEARISAEKSKEIAFAEWEKVKKESNSVIVTK